MSTKYYLKKFLKERDMKLDAYETDDFCDVGEQVMTQVEGLGAQGFVELTVKLGRFLNEVTT